MTSYSTEIFLYTFQELFYNHFNKIVESITPVSPGASVRKIFRLESGNSKAIGIFNEDKNENSAFIGFAKTFRENGFNVPEVFIVSDDKRFYLLQDLGNLTLNDELQNSSLEKQLSLSKKVLLELHLLQVKLKDKIDYSLCYQTSEFNSMVIDSDISKFRIYYPQLGKNLDLDCNILFNLFNDTLNKLRKDYFLFRDFQSRNIMVLNEENYFIDFQSGRKGPLYYDAASYIFSGSFYFEDSIKNTLIEEYKKIIADETQDESYYEYFYTLALLRLIQMLGSYSYTLIELKKDFILPKYETVYKNIEYIKNRSTSSEVTNICGMILANKYF